MAWHIALFEVLVGALGISAPVVMPRLRVTVTADLKVDVNGTHSDETLRVEDQEVSFLQRQIFLRANRARSWGSLLESIKAVRNTHEQ
ncbi:hypothetical protein TWF694_007615 [Orbilia ellipsospora]|uniref:Uncharacterized protein n=1 Tax=Orbilia ellipsospora TaxID=2528407 RepID=A0AAV9XJY9_9PEZI